MECVSAQPGGLGVERRQVSNDNRQLGKLCREVVPEVRSGVLNRVGEVSLPGHTRLESWAPKRSANPAAMAVSRISPGSFAAIHDAILCKRQEWFSTITPMTERLCSKAACSETAVATLSFDYQLSTAVIGMLSPRPEPGCYDLCLDHQRKFVPPQGWQLIRHQFLAATEKGQK